MTSDWGDPGKQQTHKASHHGNKRSHVILIFLLFVCTSCIYVLF